MKGSNLTQATRVVNSISNIILDSFNKREGRTKRNNILSFAVHAGGDNE